MNQTLKYITESFMFLGKRACHGKLFPCIFLFFIQAVLICQAKLFDMFGPVSFLFCFHTANTFSKFGMKEIFSPFHEYLIRHLSDITVMFDDRLFPWIECGYGCTLAKIISYDMVTYLVFQRKDVDDSFVINRIIIDF